MTEAYAARLPAASSRPEQAQERAAGVEGRWPRGASRETAAAASRVVLLDRPSRS